MKNVSESIRVTVTNAFVLTAICRVADVAFMYLLFSFFSIEDVATFSWAMAAAAFIGTGIDFGLSQVLLRDFSKRSISPVAAGKAIVILRFWIVMAIVCVVYEWISRANINEYKALTLWLVFCIQIMISTEGFFLAWLRGRSRQIAANRIASIEPVARVACALIVVAIVDSHKIMWLFGLLLLLHLGILAAAIFSCFDDMSEQAPYGAQSPVTIRTMLISGSAFMGIAVITVAQNRLDWLLLSRALGDAPLANYSLANKVYELLILFVGVPVTVSFPWLCRRKNSRRNDFRIDLLFRSVIIAGVCLSVVLLVYASEIIHAFWGDKYPDAPLLIKLLMPIAGLSFLNMTLYYHLIAIGWERQILYGSVVATTIQATVNLVLIPIYGSVGCVVGMASLAIVTLVFLLLQAHRAGAASVRETISMIGAMAVLYGIVTTIDAIDLSVIETIPILLLVLPLFGGFALKRRRFRKWVTAYFIRQSRFFFRQRIA